jgi:hypothetical protein
VSDRHLNGWDRSAVRVPAHDESHRAAGSGSGSGSLAAPEGSVYLALRPPGGGRAASHMPRRRRGTGRTMKTARPLPSANCAVVMTIRGIGGQCAVLPRKWDPSASFLGRPWTPRIQIHRAPENRVKDHRAAAAEKYSGTDCW